ESGGGRKSQHFDLLHTEFAELNVSERREVVNQAPDRCILHVLRDDEFGQIGVAIPGWLGDKVYQHFLDAAEPTIVVDIEECSVGIGVCATNPDIERPEVLQADL